MEVDDLGMSDEDFLNQPADFGTSEELDTSTPDEGISDDEEFDLDEHVEGDDDGVEKPTSGTDTDETDDTDSEDDDDDETDAEEEEDSEEATDDASDAVDFEAEYNKLLAPFKANGVDMQVKSPEEAIQLMQKGANYTKKMQGLQPSLKLLKMLEKNELLDETKLNHLINVSAGNPEAIKQLVKDKDVTLNVDDFDADESTEYKPKDYTVSTAEMKVAEVLSSIENTPTYARTIDVLGNKWDDSSKQTLSDDPKLISDINEHMSNGVFDKIGTEIERQKTLGGLVGLSDYNAYMTVGAQIEKAGGFNTAAPEPLATTELPSSKKDVARSKKRKAASSTKATKAKAKKEDFNPLALDDAAFAKLL